MIYITSFQRATELPLAHEQIFSAAVWQPKNHNYTKADWTDIRDKDGVWIRPREFVDQERPLWAYRAALYAHYDNRYLQARHWVEEKLARWGSIALCCWCPFEVAAQRQLREHGSFVCHTSVLGEWINTELKQPVWYDSDRVRMAVLV